MSITTRLDRAAAEDRVSVGEAEIRFRLSTAESDDAVAVLEVWIPAGGGPPMLHRHDPFELYRVESGELAIYLADERGKVNREVAGPGAVVAIPGGREHTVRNESDAEARAFVVFTPGADMERFVRAAGELGANAAPQRLLGLAAAHGIEITRPLDADDPIPATRDDGYLTITRIAGDPDELADAYRRLSNTMSGVGRDHGLIVHAAARSEGGLLIVNLWPSRDESEAAARDPRRLGVIERVGIAGDQIRPVHHETLNYVVFG
jgi:mannose-6-phosphate isomerase-like protein (cupin superfamily)